MVLHLAPMSFLGRQGLLGIHQALSKSSPLDRLNFHGQRVLSNCCSTTTSAPIQPKVVSSDQAGEVQADLAFRRADARFSFESRGIRANLEGGMLGRQTLQTASLVKSLARKTQLGQIFTFTQVAGLAVDGVFRTSVRGWFTLPHSLFTFGSRKAVRITGQNSFLTQKAFLQFLLAQA